jgi:hypothetical protein
VAGLTTGSGATDCPVGSDNVFILRRGKVRLQCLCQRERLGDHTLDQSRRHAVADLEKHRVRTQMNTFDRGAAIEERPGTGLDVFADQGMRGNHLDPTAVIGEVLRRAGRLKVSGHLADDRVLGLLRREPDLASERALTFKQGDPVAPLRRNFRDFEAWPRPAACPQRAAAG